MDDIAALGLEFSTHPEPEALPYALIGARSNQRWWLLPLGNRRVTVSGMALFQPIVFSAKMLKGCAVAASNLGLSFFLAQAKLYLTEGESRLVSIFGEGDLRYAFFTGTDSPHRKVTIQIMGADGTIRGFAKITRNSAAKLLVQQEAKILHRLGAEGLKAARIPGTLFCGEIGDAVLLVTNTEKNSASRTTTIFTKYHQAALLELAEKTGTGESLAGSVFLQNLQQRIDFWSGKVPEVWGKRLRAAAHYISGHAAAVSAEMVLCHGDFTPWNTFLVGDRLYIFDWEYAEPGYPAGYDVIHFLLSVAAAKRRLAQETLGQLGKQLREMRIADDDISVTTLLLCYLSDHSLRHIAREQPGADGKVQTWDGNLEKATLIDTILQRKV